MGKEAFEQSLWRKVIGKIPADRSYSALDEFRLEEERRAREEAYRLMRVGNMQIHHVAAEVTQDDYGLRFDTDLFFKRCAWAKRYPVIYKRLSSVPAADKGYYLAGESGCGKTVFSKTFAFELQSRGGHEAIFERDYVKFMNFTKLMEALSKDNWAYKHFILDEMKAARHLFIDDLGTEKHSEYSESLLCALLDSRLHRTIDGQPIKTYFTSNMRIDDLPYNDRVKRRIHDLSGEIIVGSVQRADRGRPNHLEKNPTNS